jgi:hypothetical protein
MPKVYTESHCCHCECTGPHEVETTIEGYDKTTVDYCTVCGYVDVDVDSVDNEDIIRDDGSEC